MLELQAPLPAIIPEGILRRAGQQQLEADLGEEGQRHSQHVLKPVHQQPHRVHGEHVLPRQRAQPQLAGPS